MNFDLNKFSDSNLDKDLILIKSEYFVLLDDDDPILYSGKSIYNNRILGSIIEDLYEEKKLRYDAILYE